jgi:diphthamide synthase (EF-2-diphthine--ammonia ligase)
MNETQTKDKKDKQLEDLNETLQRLAREKYIKNIPGAGGMLSNYRKKN